MKPRSTAILISGTGSNMTALLEAMGEGFPARPVLVLSDNAEAPGLARARAAGVSAVTVAHSTGKTRADHEARIQAVLDNAGADLVCLAGFMRLLSPGFVARWQGRMLNIHPSLLPLHPGLDTHARVLAAGDEESGCTVHEVTAELDAGPVLGQARVPVLPDDSPQTLAARVLAMEHILYPAVLERFARGDKTPVFLP